MTCLTGKQGYSSPAAAWRTIIHMVTTRALYTHAKSGKSGVAYQCGECGQWHTMRGRRPVGCPAGRSLEISI